MVLDLRDHEILHVFPSFGVGGAQIRTTQIVNGLGPEFHHSIIALDGDYACASKFADDASVRVVRFSHHSNFFPGRLMEIAQFLKQQSPSALVTYNWGAIEWGMANAVSTRYRHIHCEDGFGPDEAHKQLFRRVVARRFTLKASYNLVVPSRSLAEIAETVWKIDPQKITHIPNGIERYEVNSSFDDAFREIDHNDDDAFKIVCVSGLRPEKNLSRLLRIVSKLEKSHNYRLTVAGEGAQREALMQLTTELNLDGVVEFVGHVINVQTIMAQHDVFVLTSDTEQMPITVLEAMVCGLPVVTTDVGDIRLMLPPENSQWVVPAHDEEQFAKKLVELRRSPELREQVGSTNQKWVVQHYNKNEMIEKYCQLFMAAIVTKSPV